MLKLSTKIKIEMLKKGISAAAIARGLGYDRSAVCHVIAGRSRSKKVQEAICKALDLPLSIWDEYNNEKEVA